MDEHGRNLKRQLEALRRELDGTDNLDAESREMLEALVADVERRMDGGGQGEEGLDQIEQAAVNFEAEHPRLARVLAEITDVMSKLGI